MSGGAPVFLGEYQHTLDAKGRVSLPRRFRDETGSKLVVAKGLEKCLYVYPADGYRQFLETLLTASSLDRHARQLLRHFAPGGNPVDIDSAGRVSITAVQRDFAKLTKDVVVAGVGDHIEIWDAQAWAAYEEENASTIEDAAEELARTGIL